MAGLENPGNSQLFRENHVSQFVDRFLFFVALRILKFLNAVEDLAENVGVKIEYFLPQLPIKPGHNRNHEDKHHHAEHYANDRDQCDDRQKCALRLQVPERQEKTKRQFQFALSVAANSLEFNRGWFPGAI